MWLEPVGQDLTGINYRVTVYLGASASTLSGVKCNFLFFYTQKLNGTIPFSFLLTSIHKSIFEKPAHELDRIPRVNEAPQVNKDPSRQ